MSEICANLLKIAIIKFMRIIFMRFQHESTVTVSHLLEISPFEKAYGALTEIREVRTKLSQSCCIPVLGSVPTNVGTGLVGESSVDLAFLGTSTALSTQIPLNGSICFVRGEDSDSCFVGGRKGI